MKEIPELSHVDETWEVCVEQCASLGVSIWDPKRSRVTFAFHNKSFWEDLHKKWGLEY